MTSSAQPLDPKTPGNELFSFTLKDCKAHTGAGSRDAKLEGRHSGVLRVLSGQD